MAFPTGWTRSCALVIQHGQVTADQTAFPVLITEAGLPTEMVTLAGGNAAQSDGGDIRFSSDSLGTSQLACEVVTWVQNATPANAKAEIWVPVNVLTGSDVTIYVWYKAGGGLSQPAANASFGSEAVWDANFLVVRHFGNGTTLNVNGSAASEPSGSNTSCTASTNSAFSYGSAGFNGSSAFVDTNYTPTSLTNFSLECWWFRNAGTQFPVSARDAGGNNGIAILHEDTPGGEILFSNAGSLTRKKWGSSFANASWHYIAGTHASGSTSLTLVVNGVAGGTQTETAATNPGNGTTLKAGKENATFSAGGIQEVRLSNIARSTSWLITGYNNQHAPGSFVVAGTPSGGGGGISIAALMRSFRQRRI